MKRMFFLIVLIFVLMFQSSVYPQTSPKHFKMKAQPSVLNAAKGDKFTIMLDVNFDKGWHSYSLNEQIGPDGIGPVQTSISVNPANKIELAGKIIAPKPKSKYDKSFEMRVETYDGSIVFEIPVRAKANLDFNKDKLNIVLSLQQCDATSCLPPDDYNTIVENEIFAVSDTGNASSESISQSDANKENEGDSSSSNFENAATKAAEGSSEGTEGTKKDFWSMLILAIAAGAAALLTPCVFPMVPITVSFFTSRSEQQKDSGLRDASVYALGIILSFTILGFFFSLLFGASGIQAFTSNPWVLLGISLIFIIFTLNLFGVFEITLPTGLLNKIDSKSREGSGIVSVLLMSLAFSLASFSCTGPLIAGALVAAASGEWFYPIISMLGFSTALAAPFFLLALFPKALNKLPRAGAWMNNVKAVLGFIVIAVTLKFIDGALAEWGAGFSRESFLSLWIACGTLTTLYILGVFKLSHDSQVERVGIMRLLFALFFAFVTVYLFTGMSGKSLGFLEGYIPAAEQTAAAGFIGGGTLPAEDKWMEDYKKALEKAKEQGKSLFIDFSGRHCTNCRLMERNMFPKPNIAELMNKMVKVRLITDVKGEPFESNKKLQLEKFNTVALPLYVILGPDGKILGTSNYTSDEEEFTKFLNNGIK